MATARPKSPRPVITKPEKEESIWDKLGTLGRKKRIKEGKCFVLSKYGYVYISVVGVITYFLLILHLTK